MAQELSLNDNGFSTIDEYLALDVEDRKSILRALKDSSTLVTLTSEQIEDIDTIATHWPRLEILETRFKGGSLWWLDIGLGMLTFVVSTRWSFDFTRSVHWCEH